MVTEELRKYVRESLASGESIEYLRKTLTASGWQEGDLHDVFAEFEKAPESVHDLTQILTSSSRPIPSIATAVLIGAVFVFGGMSLYLLHDRLDLANANSAKVRQFYAQLAQSQISFTNAGEMVFPDERKFLDQKDAYMREGRNFIEADLRAMRLTLYKQGVASTTLTILTKGREGSWWETPTGDYQVLGRSANAYSSIGKVWMPYSLQFYGNYFIHGWPYHDDGTPVPQGYSGGCIRLSTEDAKRVFEFAQVGTPILVLEAREERRVGALVPRGAGVAPPSTSAKSFLIVNLESGEPLVEKEVEEKLPIASLTKLMTAVVAHEVIYLGRPIQVTPSMLASVSEIFHPTAGERYTGLDLLYPLLMQSSNDVADVFSASIGRETFVRDMNAKAASLRMADTTFADASGVSAGNVSTAYDLAKLLQYIYYKRPFLFDISKGVAFENVGLIQLGDTIPIAGLANVNEFVGSPDLIGIKNGETTAARQTMASVWNIHTAEGDVPIGIIVLGSENRKRDTEALLRWVKENYSVL